MWISHCELWESTVDIEENKKDAIWRRSEQLPGVHRGHEQQIVTT